MNQNEATKWRPRRVAGRIMGLALLAMLALSGCASTEHFGGGEGGVSGGEASLVLPDLHQATASGGISGRTLLLVGLLICACGMAFGLFSYMQLKRLPVHKAMLEISELIYTT